MCQWIGSALVQIMACHLFGAKPLSKPMLGYCQLNPKQQTSVKFQSKYKTFHSRKYIWKYCLRNGGHFVLGEMSYKVKHLFFRLSRIMALCCCLATPSNWRCWSTEGCCTLIARITVTHCRTSSWLQVSAPLTRESTTLWDSAITSEWGCCGLSINAPHMGSSIMCTN